MSTDIDSVAEQLAKTKVGSSYELSFKGRGLKLNTAADATPFVEEIEKCQTMTALRMEGNTLGVDAAGAIAKALEKHPEFERALWSDMFTGRLKPEIPPALKHLGAAIMSSGAHLVELDLSDNAFGPNGVQGFVDLLKSPSCYTLQQLKLNNNGLGTFGGTMLAKCLEECHASSCAAGKPLALKVFIAGRNRLENDAGTALAKAFTKIGTLEEVSMPQNGINHPGIAALAEAFLHNKQLRVMNLNDNTFTVKGATAMAKILPELQNLEVINFGDCLIRTEGANVIAKAIMDNHVKLKELILSGNEISKSGANAIAECLENKTQLLRLDLDANQLGEEGIDDLKLAMEAIGKLDVLGSLSGDEGDDEDEEDEEDYDDDIQEIKPVEGDGEIVNDPELVIKGKSISPQKQEISAKDFFTFPSPTKLMQLGKNRAKMIKEELGNDITDIDKTMQAYVRLTSVVSENDEKSKEAACDCADTLIQEMLYNKEIENAASLLGNSILVYLGLLKGEDKKYRAPSDITGPLIVLEYLVKQKYFPAFTREMLQVFMSRPHPALEKCSTARHRLLQTLYSF